MAVDEMLTRVRRTLEETYGVDGAAYLMDRPSGGWDALATRGDLDRFATKEDLERFATKDDLERFATKDDLERYATKEDLERFATKEDLELLELRFRTELHVELRAITRWCSTLVISSLTVSIAAMATIGAVLRFA